MREFVKKHPDILGVTAAYVGGVLVTALIGVVVVGGWRPAAMQSDASANPDYIGPAECDPRNTNPKCQNRPPVFTSPDTLPSGIRGKAYDYQLTVSGGSAPYKFETFGEGVTDPYQCCLLGVSPEGKVFSVPGVLTMPYAGTFQLGVKVTDSAKRTAQKIFTLNVDTENAGREPVITGNTTLPKGQVGEPYYYNFQFDGGSSPYVWSLSAAGNLSRAYPPGYLALSRSGVLYSTGSGSNLMPYAGTYEIRVQLTAGNQTVSRTFTLIVDPRPGDVIDKTKIPTTPKRK